MNPTPSFNAEALRKHFSGFDDVLSDSIEALGAHLTQLTEKLGASVESQNFPKIQLHAHTLKGTFANFYAGPAFGLAQEIEDAAAQRSLAVIEKKFALLKLEEDKLLRALAVLSETLGTRHE